MKGIILEGADASGKSTLARKIATSSGRNLYLAGGKPRDDEQMWRMIEAQDHALTAGDVVDRVSCVSQQVYREGLFMRDDLMNEMVNLAAEHLFVFCRPPDHIMLDQSKHEWKDYDTDEWKKTIIDGQPTFIQRYDLLMTKVPCIIYDWTAEDSVEVERILSSMHVDGMVQAIGDMIRRPA